MPLGASAELYAFGTYHQSDTEGANYFRYPDGVANWKQVYPNGYRPVSEGDNLDLALALGNIDSPTGSEGPAGEFVHDWLRDHGFQPRRTALVDSSAKKAAFLDAAAHTAAQALRRAGIEPV